MANYSNNAAESMSYVSASSDLQPAVFEGGDQEAPLINRLSEGGTASRANAESGGLSNVAGQIGSGMLDQVVNHTFEVGKSAATGLVLGQAFTIGFKVAKVPTLGLALAGGALMMTELVRNAPEWAKNIGIAYNPTGVSLTELQAAEAGLQTLGRGTVNFAASGAAFYPGSLVGKRLLAGDAGKTLGAWADKIGVGEHSALTRSFDSATGVIQARLGRFLPSERLPVSASLSGEEKAFVRNISNSIDGKYGLSAKFNTWGDQILDKFKFDMASQSPYAASGQLSEAELAAHLNAAVRHEIFRYLGDTSKPLTAATEVFPSRLHLANDAIEHQAVMLKLGQGELFSEPELAALQQFRTLVQASDQVSNRAGTALSPASIERIERFNSANERAQLLEPFVNPATLADKKALTAALEDALKVYELPTNRYFSFDEIQAMRQTEISHQPQNLIVDAFKAAVEEQKAVLEAGLSMSGELQVAGLAPAVESNAASSLPRFATVDQPRLKIPFAKDSEASALSGMQTRVALANTRATHATVKAEADRMLKANQLESGATKIYPDMTGALTVESVTSPTSSAVRFYNAKGEIQGYVTNNLHEDGYAKWLAFDNQNNLVGISVTRGYEQAYKNWLLNSRRSDGHPFPLPDLFTEV